MMSGYDPGQLGLYGFRNRKDYSYDGYAIADATTVHVDRVWDILSNAGKRVILLGAPQTYPIKPVNGIVISDFLTPSISSEYTFPPELKTAIERTVPGYVLDVEEFRTEDKAALLDRIYTKTRKHFALAKHLLQREPWDFFMMVEMGLDRIHHGFWKYMDQTHPKYASGNPFEDAIREYYRYVDEQIGQIRSLFPSDTTVLVVSDHGARKMDGGICFNEWLIQHGYLTLQRYPATPTPIAKCQIDWNRTTAWSDGGYYGRISLNVRGREPRGTLHPGDYEKVREELIDAIEALEDPHGRPLRSRAYRPEELYREVRGVPPDLMAYFGNLSWRSVGAVGLGTIHTFENDTGPDDANHEWDGIFIASGSRVPALESPRPLSGLHINDVAPTILNLFGLAPLMESQGKDILADARSDESAFGPNRR